MGWQRVGHNSATNTYTQDPVVPSWDRLFLHTLCFSSSSLRWVSRWQYLMHISWVVLQMWKPPTKWKMLITWWLWAHSPRPLGTKGLKKLTSVNTTPLPNYRPIRELCTNWSQGATTPAHLCHLAFKSASPKPFGLLRVWGFPRGSGGKESACQCRRLQFDPWLWRSPREGNGNSCLENSMDRGAWWATVSVITKSWTRLKTHAHTYRRASSVPRC